MREEHELEVDAVCFEAHTVADELDEFAVWPAGADRGVESVAVEGGARQGEEVEREVVAVDLAAHVPDDVASAAMEEVLPDGERLVGASGAGAEREVTAEVGDFALCPISESRKPLRKENVRDGGGAVVGKLALEGGRLRGARWVEARGG